MRRERELAQGRTAAEYLEALAEIKEVDAGQAQTLWKKLVALHVCFG